MKRLNPVFQVDGTPKVMLSQRLGAVASSLVEGPVANLEARRTEIIGALDIVFTGI
ncbi:MAG: CcdB family protein [Archangium sp.]|nr:CcdB family protein [Archangium sp.]